MIKKNRHRAGQKKRERILRDQQRALFTSRDTITPVLKPTVRVTPQPREPAEPVNHGPAIPLVDLTEDDTIHLIELPREDTLGSNDSGIEVLDDIRNASPSNNENIQNLNNLKQANIRSKLGVSAQ